MNDTEYLAWRAQQELKAAIAASDRWVRNVHLRLADAYSSRLKEAQVLERRASLRVVEHCAA